MEISESSFRASVEASSVTESVVVDAANGLSAFRRSVTMDVVKGKSSAFGKSLANSSVTQGIALTSELAKIAAGKAGSLHSGLSAFTPLFFSDLRGLGFSFLKPDSEYEIPDPFDAVLDGRLTADLIARVDGSSHQVFSASGVLLPAAYRLNYIDARLHDGCYDLERAAEILSADPRITFFNERGDSEIKPGAGPVIPVPYYNVSESHSMYIHARFSPTPGDAERLQRKMESYGSEYPSATRFLAMFDLDVLGLRAGGAALFKTFYRDITDGPPDNPKYAGYVKPKQKGARR